MKHPFLTAALILLLAPLVIGMMSPRSYTYAYVLEVPMNPQVAIDQISNLCTWKEWWKMIETCEPGEMDEQPGEIFKIKTMYNNHVQFRTLKSENNFSLSLTKPYFGTSLSWKFEFTKTKENSSLVKLIVEFDSYNPLMRLISNHFIDPGNSSRDFVYQLTQQMTSEI